MESAPKWSPAPLTAAAVPDEWISAVRQAMQRDGQPLRAHPSRASLEVKSLTTNQWMTLMLCGSGTTFTNAQERDIVLAKLHAKNGVHL